MITTKTCLVLGAGASAPYGFPVGSALRDLILSTRAVGGPETALQYPVRRLDGQIRDYRRDPSPNLTEEKRVIRAADSWRDHLQKCCMDVGFSDGEIAEFRNVFFRARRQSIDKFIQFNEEEFGAIGRVHIAAILLNCERDERLDGDWYVQLLDAIAPNDPDDLKPNALSVISFNYDRSFEQFFLTAFEAGFHLSAEEARRMFNRIKISHVYGQLGSLGNLPYGDTRFIREAADRISFIRDAERTECRTEMNELIGRADNVCFIGFAFAPENVALFQRARFKGKSVIATVRGLSPARLQEVKKAIPGIRFFDGTGLELLRTQNVLSRRRSVADSNFVPVKQARTNWVLGDSKWQR